VADQAGADGVTRIVEVGAKAETDREAIAECWVTMTAEALAQLVSGTKKGDPIATAKIAGVMGVKRTPDLLPRRALAVRHREVLRSRGAHRRPPAAREVRRQERRLPGPGSVGRRTYARDRAL
jgi:hypothetical protein